MTARVLYALPSVTDDMKVDSAFCAMQLAMHCAVKGIPLAASNQKGANLPTQRNVLIEDARALGASHIFFTATDMIYPANAIERLLAHNVMFAAGGYRQRYDAGRVLIEMEDGKPMTAEEAGQRRGLHRVRMTALDCALIAIDVFAGWAVPFTFRHGRTEDYCLCDDLAARGVAIHVDFDLTREVGHIGQRVYRAHVRPTPPT